MIQLRDVSDTAEKLGNAIPAISPAESLRIVTETGNLPVNRLHVKQIQTPQVFNAELIKKAYLQDYKPEFTDDATVLEKTGEKINLIEGNRENIKITNPEDLLDFKCTFTNYLLTVTFRHCDIRLISYLASELLLNTCQDQLCILYIKLNI